MNVSKTLFLDMRWFRFPFDLTSTVFIELFQILQVMSSQAPVLENYPSVKKMEKMIREEKRKMRGNSELCLLEHFHIFIKKDKRAWLVRNSHPCHPIT